MQHISLHIHSVICPPPQVFSLVVAVVSADLRGYSLPTPSYAQQRCRRGEVLNVDGKCTVPMVSRRTFLFNAPEQQLSYVPPPPIPPPKLEQNIVFIRAPEHQPGPDPIVVPPPRQRHVVYVLNKQQEQRQKVIEVPAPPPRSPEVYFVSYGEGERPTLPDGLDFQTALNAAVHVDGQVIGGDAGRGGSAGRGYAGGSFDGTSGGLGVGSGFGGGDVIHSEGHAGTSSYV